MRQLGFLVTLVTLTILALSAAAAQAQSSPAPADRALSQILPPANMCPTTPEPGKLAATPPRLIVEGLLPKPAELFCQCTSPSQCPRCPPPSQRVCKACLCDCS